MVIRPEVVTLWADIQVDPSKHYSQWVRMDGRLLTSDEIRVVGSATPDEILAASDYARRAAQYHSEMQAKFNRLIELHDRHAVEEDTDLADFVQSMPEPDRSEYVRLLADVDHEQRFI